MWQTAGRSLAGTWAKTSWKTGNTLTKENQYITAKCFAISCTLKSRWLLDKEMTSNDKSLKAKRATSWLAVLYILSGSQRFPLSWIFLPAVRNHQSGKPSNEVQAVAKTGMSLGFCEVATGAFEYHRLVSPPLSPCFTEGQSRQRSVDPWGMGNLPCHPFGTYFQARPLFTVINSAILFGMCFLRKEKSENREWGILFWRRLLFDPRSLVWILVVCDIKTDALIILSV